MPTEIETTTLLRRIASELRDLSDQTASIEAALASPDGAASEVRGEHRAILQEIDRMRQTQASLAMCLETVAQPSSSSGRIRESDLLAGAVLPSIVDRLVTGSSVVDSRVDTREPEIW